jgi:4,5-DOPA dioxygenase extradiol
MKKMPVLFIGHGSPLNVILNNNYTHSMAAWGEKLPRPKAIMVVSAHWLTNGTAVTCAGKPKTLHDFYGFPAELNELSYPSPGAFEEAVFVTQTVKRATVTCNYERGLDHGSWAVLKHLFPRADIPVFELSLDYSFNDWHPKPVQYHYDLALELVPLRSRGVLIIGSGNIVHNLGMIEFDNIDATPFDWAREIDEKVKASLVNSNREDLIHYPNLGRAATLAIPTQDHYLPMIYAVALQEKNEPLTFHHEGFQYGSISMRSFQIG